MFGMLTSFRLWARPAAAAVFPVVALGLARQVLPSGVKRHLRDRVTVSLDHLWDWSAVRWTVRRVRGPEMLVPNGSEIGDGGPPL